MTVLLKNLKSFIAEITHIRHKIGSVKEEHVSADLALQQLVNLTTDGRPNKKSKVTADYSPYITICN